MTWHAQSLPVPVIGPGDESFPDRLFPPRTRGCWLKANEFDIITFALGIAGAGLLLLAYNLITGRRTGRR
ncbi:hypothetical protein [Nonomuraea jabiensis]|uniref:hypothetical protein n=1 Tax=Nonomuraea jabiensis TaxID=882448 RepID=UPI0036C15073